MFESAMPRRRPSRGFVAALIGIGMNLLAWYGPWEWPAWPAFTALRLVFGRGFGALPPAGRAAVIVVLIAFNAAFWATIVILALQLRDLLKPKFLP